MIAGGAVKSNNDTTSTSIPPSKSTTPAKSATAPSKFSVLEYINRDDTVDTAAKVDGEVKLGVPKKQGKRVSWASESDLEQVKVIENITIKYAEDLFWHPP